MVSCSLVLEIKPSFRQWILISGYHRIIVRTDDSVSNGLVKADDSIFIAVVSSRETLGSRVKYIEQTWAAELPKRIVIRYFVGDGTESQLELARQADIQDPSHLFVMSNIVDNEYPPVYKNTRMLRYALQVMIELESANSMWDFKYFMKVDDDTFINTPALVSFLQMQTALGNSLEPNIWGRRGYGLPEQREDLRKAGMSFPYCMGGPGYIMTRNVLDQLSTGMKDCVEDINQSKYKAVLWHSDVVIGVCATRLTGAYCQGNGKDREGITPEKLNGNFLQLTGRYQLSNILKYGDVRKIVALHPLKSGQQMLFLRKSLDRRRAIACNDTRMRGSFGLIEIHSFQSCLFLMSDELAPTSRAMTEASRKA